VKTTDQDRARQLVAETIMAMFEADLPLMWMVLSNMPPILVGPRFFAKLGGSARPAIYVKKGWIGRVRWPSEQREERADRLAREAGAFLFDGDRPIWSPTTTPPWHTKRRRG
jgi:hypothetical protein